MNIEINNTEYKAVISTKGAELISLSRNGKNILWDRNEKYWADSALVLFPFIGRNYNDSYTYNGKEYNVGIHGFAFKSEFEVSEKKDNSLTLLLKENKETLAVYPFAFELQITFSLNNDGLKAIFKVTNRSDEVMPYTLGWHPGFKLEEPFENYSVWFPYAKAAKEIGIVTKCMLDGTEKKLDLEDNKLDMTRDLFNHSAKVYTGLGNAAVLLNRNNKEIAAVNYHGFENIVLWQTLNSDADFICIEGWRGLPGTYEHIDEITEIKDKSKLNPNESCTYSAEITF